MEQVASTLDAGYRDGYYQFLSGLTTLHDAVDAALVGDVPRTEEQLTAAVFHLARCNDDLSALGEGLVRTRTELFEREGVDPSDPLIARERFFAALDYEGLYRELAAHGAALPQRAFWDEIVGRVRDGGARAGLRLLDRHLRELQSDLRSYLGEVEVMRRLPGRAMAEALHDTSRAVAAVIAGFTRLVTTFTYFSILCERASKAHGRASETREAVAVAG